MDWVPGEVIYALTLDGKGGMAPLTAGSEIPGIAPAGCIWIMVIPIRRAGCCKPRYWVRRPRSRCSARAIVPSWCGWGRRCC